MAEKTKAQEVSTLYLELASACFTKAATAKDAVSADALRLMGRSYFAQAVALNPSLGSMSNLPEETLGTVRDP